jgi:signal peptide peptidase SppA
MTKTISPSLRFLASTAWAIEDDTFRRLVSLLENHAAGERVSADQLAAITPAVSGEAKMVIDNGTAVIPIRGVIARYSDQINGICQDSGRSAESIQSDLLAAFDNPKVSRIVLRIDSPGGDVQGTAETANLVRHISAAGKRVVAFADGKMASAALWIGSQADEVIASAETAVIGSIGVATTITERAQIDGQQKVHVITSAPAKASGGPLNSAQLDNARNLVSDLATAFAEAVACGRGMTAEEIASVATGEVWAASKAVKLGLVDAIASFNQVMAGNYTVEKKSSPKGAAPACADQTIADLKASTEPQKEQPMAISVKDLAALSAQYPGKAAEIVAMADADSATLDGIKAALFDADLKAKDAEISALKATIEQEKTARAKVDADLSAKSEALAKLEAHVPKHGDVGSGEQSALPEFTKADAAAGRIPSAVLTSGKYRIKE